MEAGRDGRMVTGGGGARKEIKGGKKGVCFRSWGALEGMEEGEQGERKERKSLGTRKRWNGTGRREKKRNK